jgi:hypothetical protein
MLATLGAITCSARGNIAEVVGAPAVRCSISVFWTTLSRIVSAVGEAPTIAFLESARTTLTTRDRRRTGRYRLLLPIRSVAQASNPLQLRGRI